VALDAHNAALVAALEGKSYRKTPPRRAERRLRKSSKVVKVSARKEVWQARVATSRRRRIGVRLTL